MSKWRVAYGDGGTWFLSEIGDQWGGFESFDTEADALAELRRVQIRAVENAVSDLKIARKRLAEKREHLAAEPKVSRMKASPT